MFSNVDQPFWTSYPSPCCGTVSSEEFPLGVCLLSPFLQAKQQKHLGVGTECEAQELYGTVLVGGW